MEHTTYNLWVPPTPVVFTRGHRWFKTRGVIAEAVRRKLRVVADRFGARLSAQNWVCRHTDHDARLRFTFTVHGPWRQITETEAAQDITVAIVDLWRTGDELLHVFSHRAGIDGRATAADIWRNIVCAFEHEVTDWSFSPVPTSKLRDEHGQPRKCLLYTTLPAPPMDEALAVHVEEEEEEYEPPEAASRGCCEAVAAALRLLWLWFTEPRQMWRATRKI